MLVAKRLYLNNEVRPATFRLSRNSPLERTFPKGRLGSELELDILLSVRGCDPTLLENIVVELLVKMGYGGSRKDAGRAIRRSGDEGIDGIIKEDHLGLDNIYI